MRVIRISFGFLIAFFFTLPAVAYFPQWIITPAPSGAASATPISAVDFNGDSIPDVLASSGHRAIVHFVQEGGIFKSGASFSYTASYLAGVEAADADGNGTQDLIVSDKGTNVLTFIGGNGDGTFGAPRSTPLSIAPSQIASGDFDEDGHLDVLVRSYSAAALVLGVGDGAGAFAESTRRDLSPSSSDMTTGDVDADGHLDVLVTNNAPVALELYFGVGDGTFTGPVVLDETTRPSRIKFADLDSDGDPEIISSSFYENSLSVRLNHGSRTFGAETVYYPLAVPSDYGNPQDFAVFDATEDGKADVVLNLANENLIATFPGTGTGFLDVPTLQWTGPGSGYSEYLPVFMAAADFTRDGRPDLAITSGFGYARIFRNVTGGLQIFAKAVHPTITEGQPGTYRVDLRSIDGATYLLGEGNNPLPTGLVTIRSGDTVVGSGVLDGLTATIEVSGLALGTHALTARFEGDDEFYPIASGEISQTVVAERTTARLETNAPAEVPYGDDIVLLMSAASSDGQPLTGNFYLYTNGERSPSTRSGSSWSLSDLEPGTYEFQVTFEGTSTQPPSRSNSVTRTVTKSTPHVILPYYDVTVVAGETSDLDVRVEGAGTDTWGTVRLYSSSTLIGTATRAEGECCWDTFSFDLSGLEPGVHYLRAFYDGNFRYHPAVSTDPIQYRVVPNAPLYVDAVVRGVSIYVTAHHAGDRGPRYRILQRIGRGSWTAEDLYWPEHSIGSVPERVVYTFRMDRLDSNGVLMTTGNMDIAMRFPFTDQPLMPGAPIKALHISELVEATNLVRVAAGLPPVSLSGVGAGQPMRAEHVTSLRTALNDARVRLGANAAVFSTDLGSRMPIRAHHIQELREAMQ